MAGKKKQPTAAPEVVFTPDPALEHETAADAATEPPRAAHAAGDDAGVHAGDEPRAIATRPPPRARYRVLAGGISTATGTVWRGQVVAAEQLGNAERVKALIEKRAIEAADESH
jgi:hypothetical protein